MLEQFVGPQGELAAACRDVTQYLAEDDPGRRDKDVRSEREGRRRGPLGGARG